jgi:hypothetical protein
VFGVVLLTAATILASVAHSELLQSDETSDIRRTPRSSDVPHRVAPSNEGIRGFTPKSYVPLRSPDLGFAYFPLSPSIGPGSSSLGPAAAPDVSRRGSNTEGELERNRSAGGHDSGGRTILRGYTGLCVSAVFVIRCRAARIRSNHSLRRSR